VTPFLVVSLAVAFVASVVSYAAAHQDPRVAVGPAYVDSFTVSCGTSATAITATAQISYTCQNNSTTKVAVGDSTIADPSGTQNSPIYCATNCASREWGGNARVEYCRAPTTTTIYCRSLVQTSSAP
jgi:hypothetical protein